MTISESINSIKMDWQMCFEDADLRHTCKNCGMPVEGGHDRCDNCLCPINREGEI